MTPLASRVEQFMKAQNYRRVRVAALCARYKGASEAAIEAVRAPGLLVSRQAGDLWITCHAVRPSTNLLKESDALPVERVRTSYRSAA